MSDTIRKIYDAMSQNYEMVEDYETFAKGLADPKARRTVYDAMSQNYEMDKWEDFDSVLTASIPKPAETQPDSMLGAWGEGPKAPVAESAETAEASMLTAIPKTQDDTGDLWGQGLQNLIRAGATIFDYAQHLNRAAEKFGLDRTITGKKYEAPDYGAVADSIRAAVDRMDIEQPTGKYARAPEKLSEYLTDPKRFVHLTVTNAPTTAALAAMTVVAPATAVMTMNMIEGGQTAATIREYEKKTGRKLDSAQATLAPFVVGAVNAALEKTGIDKILDKSAASKSVKDAAKRILFSGLIEGGTELAQENNQILSEIFTDQGLDPQWSDRLVANTVAGLGSGGTLTGGGTAASTIYEKASERRQARMRMDKYIDSTQEDLRKQVSKAIKEEPITEEVVPTETETATQRAAELAKTQAELEQASPEEKAAPVVAENATGEPTIKENLIVAPPVQQSDQMVEKPSISTGLETTVKWDAPQAAIEGKPVSMSYVEAKKRPDNKWQLFYRGTRNEVFPNELFNSANEARSFYKSQWVKAGQAKQPDQTVTIPTQLQVTGDESVQSSPQVGPSAPKVGEEQETAPLVVERDATGFKPIILQKNDEFTASINTAQNPQGEAVDQFLKIEFNDGSSFAYYGKNADGSLAYDIEGSGEQLRDWGFDSRTFTIDEGKVAARINKLLKGANAPESIKKLLGTVPKTGTSVPKKGTEGVQFMPQPVPAASVSKKSVPGMGVLKAGKVLQDLPYKFNIPIRVLGSEEDVEGEIGETARAERAKGNIASGYYDPNANEVVVLADNIRNESDLLKLVLPHEIAHYGVRGMMGDENYNAFLKTLQQDGLISKEIKTLAEEYGWKDDYAAAEWFAMRAEGKEISSVKSPAAWQRALDAMVKFFRNLFRDQKIIFTRSDIEEILKQSFDFAQQPEALISRGSGEAALRSTMSETLRQLKDIYKAIDELPPTRSGQPTTALRQRLEAKAAELEKKITSGEVQFRTEKEKEEILSGETYIDEEGNIKRAVFDLDPETRLQRFMRYVQNDMARLETVQKTIEQATGQKITPEADAYTRHVLESGRVAHLADKFMEQMVHGENSFLARLDKTGIDYNDFGLYLTALHTPERRNVVINRKIEKSTSEKNKAAWQTRLEDKNDTFGSGMSENKAKSIIADMEREHPDVKKFADEFYNTVTNKALKIRLDNGLISQETFNTLNGTYKYYAPLKGRADIKDKFPGQSKLSGRMASGVKRAGGRESEANNPFAQALVDYIDAISRTEQNKVRQAFLRLVEENPAPDIWEVQSLQYIPRVDDEGNIKYYDPLHKYEDNVLEVLENGKTKIITIKDKPLADGMRNIGIKRGFQLFHNINGYLRAVNIMLSPEFLITNMERDLQTALIHISGEQSARMAKNTLKHLPSAIKGIWTDVRGGDTEWSEYYEELKAAGGKVGWMSLESAEEMTKRINAELENLHPSKKTTPMRLIRSAGKLIQNANESVEMGVRLSFYRTMRESGFSVDESARAAKELTVNFNTRGQIGPMLNSLYLFANANVQGSFRIISAIKNSKKVQKIVAGIVVLSFLSNLFNRWMNEDEWEQYSDYNKDSHWLWMLPGGKTLAIKTAYGYNIFNVLGNITEEAMSKKITLGEASSRLFGAINNSFNPLGGGTMLQMLSPTTIDPFIQVSENKNFFGGPIRKEQPAFSPKKPESSLYFKSVNPWTRALTTWLNKVTGGSTLVSGSIDISPETLDYVIDWMGGGLGRFITNALHSGTKLIESKDAPDINKMPVVRTLIKESSEWTNPTVVREILARSGNNILSEIELKRFDKALNRALEDKTLTPTQAETYREDLKKNQAAAKASLEGFLSRDELLDAYEEYYFTDPGKRSFAQLDQLNKQIREYNSRAQRTGETRIKSADTSRRRSTGNERRTGKKAPSGNSGSKRGPSRPSGPQSPKPLRPTGPGF